jgi:rhodanese-related sulfurtransferase
MLQISATELGEWLQDAGRPAPVLLDVREPEEFSAYRIEGSQLMPMRTLPARLHELDHHAGLFLRQNGFERVYNLAGGVIAWSRDVESAAA